GRSFGTTSELNRPRFGRSPTSATRWKVPWEATGRPAPIAPALSTAASTNSWPDIAGATLGATCPTNPGRSQTNSISRRRSGAGSTVSNRTQTRGYETEGHWFESSRAHARISLGYLVCGASHAPIFADELESWGTVRPRTDRSDQSSLRRDPRGATSPMVSRYTYPCMAIGFRHST